MMSLLGVVICLKISIFVVATTTLGIFVVIIYCVVICLKISIFVVATTTSYEGICRSA